MPHIRIITQRNVTSAHSLHWAVCNRMRIKQPVHILREKLATVLSGRFGMSLACSETKVPVEESKSELDPYAFSDLVQSLGHTHFAQDIDLVWNQVMELVQSDEPRKLTQRYVHLVLSTRTRLEDDPTYDAQLVVAASNAITVLHYGGLFGLIEFDFFSVRDWSRIRIPGACLNLAVLSHCVFDYADLSDVSMFLVHANGTSFKFANLRGVTTFEGPTLSLNRISFRDTAKPVFSPDGRTLLAVFPSSTVVWNLDLYKGRSLSPADGGGSSAVAFSADSCLLATGNKSTSEIHLYEVKSMKSVATLLAATDKNPVQALAFAEDGLSLAAGGEDGLRIWSLMGNEWKLVANIHGHDAGNVQALNFHPNCKQLVTSSRDIRIRLWDLEGDAPKCLTSWLADEPSPRVIFSKDGTHIAALRPGANTVSVWDTMNADARSILSIPRFQAFGEGPTFKSADEILARDGADGGNGKESSDEQELQRQWEQLCLNPWEFFTSQEINCPVYLIPRDSILWTHPKHMFAAASANGRYLARPIGPGCAAVHDTRIGSWLAMFRRHIAMRVKSDPGAQLYLTAVAVEGIKISPTGSVVAIRTETSAILMDTAEGRYLGGIFPGNFDSRVWLNPQLLEDNRIRHVDFSPDGQHLLAYCNRVRAKWNVAAASFDEIATDCRPPVDLDITSKCAFSSDRSRLIIRHRDDMVLMGYESQAVLWRMHMPDQSRSTNLAFAPDGRTFAFTRSENSKTLLQVFTTAERDGMHVPTSQLEMELSMVPPNHMTELRIIFSPDSQQVLVSGYEFKLFIVDIHRSVISTIGEDEELRDIMHMVFSSDGRFIITAKSHGMIQVVDVRSGKCVKRIQDRNRVSKLEISSDNSLLVTAGDGSLRFWRLALPSSAATEVSAEYVVCTYLRTVGLHWWACIQRCDFTGAVTPAELELLNTLRVVQVTE